MPLPLLGSVAAGHRTIRFLFLSPFNFVFFPKMYESFMMMAKMMPTLAEYILEYIRVYLREL
jgi:hypothetical protein